MKTILAMILALLTNFDEAAEIAAAQATLVIVQNASKVKPQEKKATPKRPRKHIVAIIGSPGTCAPCERFKNGPAKKLEKSGWTFGEDGHIEYVVSTEDVCQKYGVNALPTFILMEGDNVVDRREGYIDQWEIGRLWKSKPTK